MIPERPFITPIEEKGKTIFPNHAEISASFVQERMKTLAFSNEEINFVRINNPVSYVRKT